MSGGGNIATTRPCLYGSTRIGPKSVARQQTSKEGVSRLDTDIESTSVEDRQYLAERRHSPATATRTLAIRRSTTERGNHGGSKREVGHDARQRIRLALQPFPHSTTGSASSYRSNLTAYLTALILPLSLRAPTSDGAAMLPLCAPEGNATCVG